MPWRFFYIASVFIATIIVVSTALHATDEMSMTQRPVQTNLSDSAAVTSDGDSVEDDFRFTGSLSELRRYRLSNPPSNASFDVLATLVFASRNWTTVMACDHHGRVSFRVDPQMAQQIAELDPGTVIRFIGPIAPLNEDLHLSSFQLENRTVSPRVLDARALTDTRNRAVGHFVQTIGLVREVLQRPDQTIYSTRVVGVPVNVEIHDSLTVDDAMTVLGRQVRMRAGLKGLPRSPDVPPSNKLLVMKKSLIEVMLEDDDEGSFQPLDQVDESIRAVMVNSMTLRNGQIAFTDGKELLVVSNKSEAFVVRSELASFFSVGQRVNVFGTELKRADRATQLRSKVISAVSIGELPPPARTTIAELRSGNYPPRIAVEARVVSCIINQFTCRLILQHRQQMFQAVIPMKDDSDVERVECLLPGSYISIVGAPVRLRVPGKSSNSLTRDDSVERVPLTLFAASVDGVTIRSSPYMLQASQIVWVIAILGLVLFCGLLWNRVLTRQVAHRTARLNAITSHLATAFDAIQEGVVLVDASGTVVRKNQRFEDLFDSAPQTGQPIAKFFEQLSKNTPVTEFDAFWQIARRNIDQGFHGELRCKATQRILQVYSHPIIHHDGGTVDGKSNRGRLWAFTDVTEQRRLEEQLFRVQKMELVGQLSGGIAHDFNNLLTVIRTSLSMIDRSTRRTTTTHLSGRTGGEALLNGTTPTITSQFASDPNESLIIEFTEAAHKAVDRAVELTDHLLDYSRRSRLDIAVVDINQVVRGVYQLIRRTLPPTIEIAVRATPSSAQARVDLAKIEQVIINLCHNACDAIGDRPGHLFLETRLIADDDLGDSVVITVLDDGQGIDEADLDRVFEPFFTTKSNGTGLGLAMALGVIENHGGRIECHSKPNFGTEFNIWLPKATSENPSPVPPACDLGNEPARASGAKLRLLIVDDTPRDRQTAEALFTELGHDVVSTSSGESAIEYLGDTDSFDLVILDHHISGLPAAKVYQKIRHRWPDQQVALCSRPTDRDRTQRAVLAWDQPPPIVFTKPFRVDELRRLLETCTMPIDKPAAPTSS